MGILNDIDTTISNADAFVGTFAERNIDIDNIVFDTVKPDSCHYSILKKFHAHHYGKQSRIVERQIAKYEWDCTNLLKYFGLDNIYKGITICIDMDSTMYWGYQNMNSRLVMIYRGHKRKDDFAYLLKSHAGAATSHLRSARFTLHQLFNSERDFNRLFTEVRTASRIPADLGHKYLNF